MFTTGALNLIHQASVGVLRSIGTIAAAGMGKAYAGDSPTVETEHVQAVISRLRQRGNLGSCTLFFEITAVRLS